MINPQANKVFTYVFLILFVDLIAFTLILPILPKILNYYSRNDKSGSYKLFNDNLKIIQNFIGVPESYNQVLLAGLLGSWFSLLQFISSPFFGALSDRFGRKPILLISTIGTLISYLLWFNAGYSFTLFLLSRTIGGLCKANVSLSLAIVSDVSNEKNRGKGMAIIGSSFSLAFIFGPLIGASSAMRTVGARIEDELITNPAQRALQLCLLDIIMIFLLLKETNHKRTKRIILGRQNGLLRSNMAHINGGGNSKISSINPIDFINPYSLFNFKLIGTDVPDVIIRRLKKSGLIYFYYLLFYSGLEFTLPFLTHIRFGFTPTDQGMLYLFSGLLMALVQGGYIRRMEPGNESKMTLFGLFVIVPSFVIMGLAGSVSQILLSLGMYSFASAIVVPCLTTIASSHSHEENRGVVMGTFRSIGALARAFGPLIGSVLFWTLGPTLCYIIGATALILPLSLMKELHALIQGYDDIPRDAIIHPSLSLSTRHHQSPSSLDSLSSTQPTATVTPMVEKLWKRAPSSIILGELRAPSTNAFDTRDQFGHQKKKRVSFKLGIAKAN